MAVCKNAFHNGAVTYTHYKFIKYYSHNLCGMCGFNGSNICSFNLKPDDCNLATTNLVHKLSQLGLIFSKMHPDFNITEKNPM